LQVQRGLAQRLVLSEDDLLGRVTVLGLEAETLTGFGIDAVKLFATLASADQTVTDLHKH
jgi:hypothetical protein